MPFYLVPKLGNGTKMHVLLRIDFEEKTVNKIYSFTFVQKKYCLILSIIFYCNASYLHHTININEMTDRYRLRAIPKALNNI